MPLSREDRNGLLCTLILGGLVAALLGGLIDPMQFWLLMVLLAGFGLGYFARPRA